MPSLRDVHMRPIPVIKYVPKQLRGLWSQCVSRALANAEFHNDVASWTALQMLTKSVLCAPPRAGKQHQNQRIAFTRARMQRWLDGEYAALWQDLPTYRVGKRKVFTEEAESYMRHKRCEDLCREGADSKACKALCAPGLLDPGAAREEMSAKHPPASRPVDLSSLSPVNFGLVPDLNVDDLKECLSSFNKHSGGGPSGLRPFHLRQSLSPAHSDQVLEHLCAVVNMLARGGAHPDIAPWLCGALLMAVPKKDGSARPIAVGEVLRRLTAKALCASVKEAARDYLWPLQVGAAQPLRGRNWHTGGSAMVPTITGGS